MSRNALKRLVWPTIAQMAMACCLVTVSSWACYILVTPSWSVPGWPSFHSYPKNVERTCLAWSLLTLLVYYYLCPALQRINLLRTIICLIAVIILGLYVDWQSPAIAVLPYRILISFILAAFVWAALIAHSNTEHPVGTRRHHRTSPWHIVALFLACWTAMRQFVPLQVDLHHHGERLTSAIDLLQGGVPFRTHIWPHGLHDSGLVALWTVLLGKVGTSSIVLAKATICGIGSYVTYTLLRRLSLSGAMACLVCICLSIGSHENIWLRMGTMLFVFLSFDVVTKRGHISPLRACVAGALVGMGHLYRIDSSIYAVVAIILYCVWNVLLCPRDRWTDVLRDWRGALHLVVILLAIFVGFATPIVIARTLFDIPSAEWIETVFLTWARYHADSTGLPQPLPLKALSDSFQHRYELVASNTGNLLFIGTVIAMVLTQMQKTSRSLITERSSRSFIIWMCFFVLALNTGFSRSDGHVHYYMTAFYLIVIGWSVARAVRRPIVAALVLTAMCLQFDFYNSWQDSRPIYAANWKTLDPRVIAGHWQAFKEHTRPNPPDPCGNILLTQSEIERNHLLVRAICETKRLVRKAGLRDRELLVGHSASWLYPALGLTNPTRYYCLGWAMTPRLEEELIADLQRSKVRAFLRVRGFRALTIYDVPDDHRLPKVMKFIRNKIQVASAIDTPLGTLWIRP